MRRHFFHAVGLCLAPLVGLSLSQASELDGKRARPAVPAKTVVAPKKAEATCGSHGTQVDFVATPSEAATIAKKEKKLVFVLHVSGNFEDPRFT